MAIWETRIYALGWGLCMTGLSTLDFFDPRGRIDRQGLIIFAAVLIGLQAGAYGALWMNGFYLDSGFAHAVNAPFFWMGMAAVSKRLHDLNLSAWWLAASAAGCLAWCFVFSLAVVFALGEDAFTQSETGMIVAVIGALTPLAVLTLWLHCAKGEIVDNPFGPRPGTTGFSQSWGGQAWHAAQSGPTAPA